MTMAEAKTRVGRKRKARTPLMEQQTATALRRRGVEAGGVVLLLLATASLLMLWTYNWRDPSFFSATDAEPTNALGLIGASLADPLHRALGWAAYGLPVGLFVWGLRFVLHKGEGRAISRMVLIPIAIAVAAVFASGHVPFASWIHPYGLGGVFGDSLFLSVMSVIPLPPHIAIPVTTLLAALAFAAMALVAGGVSWPEFKSMLRSVGRGLRTSVSGFTFLAGRSVKGAAKGAARARERKRTAPPHDRAERRAEPSLHGDALADEDDGYRAPKTILPDEDRVMARIAAAVRNRRGQDQDDDVAEVVEPAQVPAERVEPPVTARAEPSRPAPRVQQPERKPVAKSTRAKAEEQPRLALDPSDGAAYDVPPLSLLESPSTIVRHTLSNEALEQNARMLETVLEDYGVKGEIVSVRPGPVVTMYELEPAAGLKASRVIGLADDIARSMSALAARVSTIPGRTVIGIELPNEHREKVLLREILSGKSYGDGAHALPLALGKDIARRSG